ncbi:MAG TPA: CNNM domain-containing protein [Steroidobacteraceae bacterium]|jgi:Mg2+/Co2+ transporter CorB
MPQFTSINWPIGCTLAIVALVLLAALFAATEAALSNVSRYRLRSQARLGSHPARRTEKLLQRADQLTGAILLCRTIANILAASLTAVLALQLGGAWLMAAAAAILIFVVLVFADALPKTLGTLYAELIALRMSWICSILVRTLQPIVWAIDTFARGLLRTLGMSAPAGTVTTLALDGLRAANSDARIDTRSHQRMLASILDLQSIRVEDIMIPRSEIAAIDISDDWDTILEMLRTTPHTRLPLCEENLDNIIGIVHMKKVAHSLAHGDISREALLQLAQEREAYFVPEGTALDIQLQNFQRDRRRIALVVDEYGDIQGLVTLEDILEEIVGEFTSDPSTLHKDIHREANGSYVVSGTINVRVLNRTLGWSLPTAGPRTLNGLILEYLEDIPEPGTGLKLGDLSIEILQTSENAVKTARIRPIRVAEGVTGDG